MNKENQEIKYVPVPTSTAGFMAMIGAFAILAYANYRKAISITDAIKIKELEPIE